MRQDDALWKSILESTFEDFLRFFFRDADEVIDFHRGFEFLDKELAQLCISGRRRAPKVIDKLAKVYMRGGKEEWLLLHIEVQGYREPGFEKRMFRYCYRLMDKYEKPITAIVILTDPHTSFRPAEYQHNCFGTSLRYRFNSYKLLDQQEADLLNDENPFSFVILTVLLALKGKKLPENELLNKKIELARKLLSRNLPKNKTRSLLAFLKNYIQFENVDNNDKFEKAISQSPENDKNMGIIEFLMDREKKKGIEEGRREGRKEGLQEGIKEGKSLLVRCLLHQTTLTIPKIASVAKVSPYFVRQIKKTLK